MKRMIALLLAVIMVLSMAACGNKKPDVTEPTGNATSDEATQPTEFTPFVPELGEGVYCKTSYTVADQELTDNRELVVATAGGRELTLGVLQIYYWMTIYGFLNEYGAYASYFGLDISKPLDQQQCPEGEGTWQQYFLETAVDTWHSYQCLVLQGEAENSPMDPELQKELDDLQTNLEKSAQEGEYASVQEMLTKDIGPGFNFDDYYKYLSVYSTGFSHYKYRCDHIDLTDDILEDYFTKNEAAYAESGITKDSKLVNVRHILIAPKGETDETGNTTYSDAAWSDCEKKAQDLLDRYLEGAKTEDFFAELAELYTEDPGSKETGGLYEKVKPGDMVEEFDAWCFDDSRKVGDTGLVKTTYGYHVMFYSGNSPRWIEQCREDLTDEKIAEFVNAAVDAHELKADYEKMMLGHKDLAG